MTTTRPTRPPMRNWPKAVASDIFGGPCPLTACPSLPAPPWLHVGVVGAHPGRSSSPPHPPLWRVYTVLELVGSRGGRALLVTASRPNIPRCTKSLLPGQLQVRSRVSQKISTKLIELEKLDCSIGDGTINFGAVFVMRNIRM